MPIAWESLQEIVRTRQRYVLSTHVRPDADAIGSELAMAGLLELLGKSVRIVNADAVPPRLAFLDPQKRCLQIGAGVTEAEALDADVHMILDTSAWNQLARMGNVFRKTAALKVVIDHHASAEDIGGIPFKDVEAEATGALVFQFAESLGIQPTPQIATAMFCAIATDTGWFRFPSTSSQTLRTVARLMECGAQPALLYQQLYEQNSPARMRLLSRVLGRIALECGGRLAHTWVRFDDYAETGSDPSETEDMVNYCLTIAGVQAAFIQIEQSNKMIKTSLRSRSHLNVAQVAAKFDGGGHNQAAGAILPGPLPDARARILAAMNALLQT